MANADADAFEHNEWQALIDSKDYKGLFEKDPVRMTQAIMRMNEAAKGSPAGAAMGQEHPADAGKAVQAARGRADVPSPVPGARMDAAKLAAPMQGASQRDASARLPQRAGAASLDAIPAQSIPAPSIPVPGTAHGQESIAHGQGLEATREAVQETPEARQQRMEQEESVRRQRAEEAGFRPAAFPRTSDTPVQQQARNRNAVVAQDAALLRDAAYKEARGRGDWRTAAQVAEAAGKPELAQFLRMAGGTAQEQTGASMPSIVENITQAGREMPGTAAPVMPLVPQALPIAQEGRMAIGKELAHVLANTRIPLTNNLKGKLLQGSPRAIRYGKRLLDAQIAKGSVTPAEVEAVRRGLRETPLKAGQKAAAGGTLCGGTWHAGNGRRARDRGHPSRGEACPKARRRNARLGRAEYPKRYERDAAGHSNA